MSSESNMNHATLGGRIAHRAKTFNARFDWMGPTIAALSVWYFLAQIIVGWVFESSSELTSWRSAVQLCDEYDQ